MNALVGLGFLEHEFHQRVALWVRSLAKAKDYRLLTCPITELGFVRVLAQATHGGSSEDTSAKSEGTGKSAFRVCRRQSRHLSASCLGEKRATNHRRASMRVGEGARRCPCNFGRTDSFRICHPGLESRAEARKFRNRTGHDSSGSTSMVRAARVINSSLVNRPFHTSVRRRLQLGTGSATLTRSSSNARGSGHRNPYFKNRRSLPPQPAQSD